MTASRGGAQADVVFYVSGHGFGHASRDIEIVNALLARRPGVRVQFRTTAATWLFALTVKGASTCVRAECDTGVVQRDSLTPDLDATAATLKSFYATIDARVDAEAAVVRATGARLVLADMPPLAFEAASRAGIPVVGVGNFTWDWIYDGYARLLGEAAWVPAWIRAAHARAVEAWRLPMHGGFDGFARVRDLPLVARRSSAMREDLRRRLGARTTVPLLLVSFGGCGLADDGVEAARRLGAFDIAVAMPPRGRRADGPLVVRDGNVLHVDEHAWYAEGLRYEDLVLAADAVITKPGYGIIAECLANDTAIVYTSRGEFAEYDVLVDALRRHGRAAFISNADLAAGRWAEPLADALSQPARAAIDACGADVAATWILERLDAGA